MADSNEPVGAWMPRISASERGGMATSPDARRAIDDVGIALADIDAAGLELRPCAATSTTVSADSAVQPPGKSAR